jgi:8-amino-7-oxononanoate synthase
MIAFTLSVLDDIRSQLAELEAARLLRRPLTLERAGPVEMTIDGRSVLVFCSNDYLGLSWSPELIAAVKGALDAHGLGAGASRLISGTSPAHLEAERALASLVGQPAALLFSSGYAANVGALSTLLGKEDVAFSDRLNHASLIDGLRLSRARVHVHRHNDVEHLESLLRAHRADGRRAWVVTDSVFSMDGDLAPLRELRAVADRWDAGLFVDEAHALGILGGGRGLCHARGVTPDALVGTLGKSAGVAGAFVAGPAELRSLLENRARSYVFSTAPPAAIAEAARVAADLVLRAENTRARVLAHAARLRSGLRERGWDVPTGETPIVPVVVGDPARTMRLSAELLERGFFVRGIRPPTVPAGTSRLRVVPTAAHTTEQIDALLRAFPEPPAR